MSFLLLAAVFIFAALPVHAACTSPAGEEGKVIYNADYHVLQYCDGSDWRELVGTIIEPEADCTDDASVICTLEATRANDDPDFASGNIRGGVNILNVTGSILNCSDDATGECILESTRSSDDPEFTASNIRTGVNVLGVTGTLVEASPDCTDDASVTCTLEAARSSDDPDFAAGNIRGGVNILNVTGSLAECTNDATGECILESTRSSDDAQFTASNIRSGTNILGVTGTVVEASPDCTDDASVTCTLESARSSDDPDFASGNIRGGVNILNVTGSLADCTNDATGECILESTRSSDDAQFTASNIRSGTNILGVTGTVVEVSPDCTDDASVTCTLEATRANDDPDFIASNIKHRVTILGVTGTYPCSNIGDECPDGTIYAGLTPDGNVPMYVPPSDQSSGAYWGTYNYTTGATSYTDGDGNQADVYAHVMNGDGTYNPDDGKTPNAFVLCEDLTYGGHSDWYLPARDELKVLYNNAAAIGGFDTSGTFYWSSSEYNKFHAWGRRFSDGFQSYFLKDEAFAVRCARHD
jgi:hypothetical protein